MIRLGICGFGYWGPNLLRTFAANPGFTVAAVADRDESRLANVRQRERGAADSSRGRRADRFAGAGRGGDRHAVRDALRACLTGTQEEQACPRRKADVHDVAEGREHGGGPRGSVLMVDQTYVFHRVVQKLRDSNGAARWGPSPPTIPSGSTSASSSRI